MVPRMADMATVQYSDLEMALSFVSSGEIVEACAYISRESGKIYWMSDEADLEEDLPDDLDDPKQYAVVPDKRDLDLGKALVLRFTAQTLPDKYDEVEAIFARKGAYARYKDFLSRNACLDEWHTFEESSTRELLCEWAVEEGFDVEIELRGPAA